jgi:hypothetical protein
VIPSHVEEGRMKQLDDVLLIQRAVDGLVQKLSLPD